MIYSFFHAFLFKLFCLYFGQISLFLVIGDWMFCQWNLLVLSFILRHKSQPPSWHSRTWISELLNSNETSLISDKCSLSKMFWWSQILKVPVKKSSVKIICHNLALKNWQSVNDKDCSHHVFFCWGRWNSIQTRGKSAPLLSFLYQPLSLQTLKSEEMIKFKTREMH